MALETVTTMTADELLAMPSDGYRYELIRGELRQMFPKNAWKLLATELAKNGRPNLPYAQKSLAGQLLAL